MARHLFHSPSRRPEIKNQAGVHLLLVLLHLVCLWSNLAKVHTNDGKSKHIWITVTRKEQILDTEYGNKYHSHVIAGMYDGFIIGHITILSPGTIGIYRCHRQQIGTHTRGKVSYPPLLLSIYSRPGVYWHYDSIYTPCLNEASIYSSKYSTRMINHTSETLF